MKSTFLLTINRLTCTALALTLPFIGGCQKSNTNEGWKEGETISLNEISDHPAYSALPLVGTSWQLTGFVNTKQNTIKLAEPLGKGIFRLTFEENGLLSGFTSTNRAGGAYKLTASNHVTSINFGQETFINELFDGNRFVAAMKNISSYQITTKGLFLIYAEDECLLFHQMKE